MQPFNWKNLTLPLLSALLIALIAWSEIIVRPVPQTGRVEVVYWDKYTEFEETALRKIVDYYNQSQDKIYVNFLSVSDIQSKTLMAIAGGAPPDIAGLFAPDIAQYADANALTPLDDYCSEAGLTQKHYIPFFWDVCNYRGHTYALPSAAGSTALHLNTEMLLKAGLDPQKPPKTIEELDAMVEKITKKNSDGTLQAAGFFPSEPDWWVWSWGYFFGGRLWDGKSRITANSPENIRAYEWVSHFSKRFGANHVLNFRAGFGNFSSPQNAFLSNKVAMEMQGVWMDNFVSRYAPTVKYTVAPFPYPADRPDLANPTLADTDVFVIPRGAKHANEAFEFIKFMESQKGMEMLTLGHHIISPLIQQSKELQTKHPHPYIKLFAELPLSENTYFPPKLGIWREYQSEMENAFQEVTLLHKTPKEALDRVTERMQPKLDNYLKVRSLREGLSEGQSE